MSLLDLGPWQVFDDLQAEEGFRRRCYTARQARHTRSSAASSQSATDSPRTELDMPGGYSEAKPNSADSQPTSLDIPRALGAPSSLAESPPARETHRKQVPPHSARGYMVGPGAVYGGDYSIYKTADPSKAHSIATVRVIQRPTITSNVTTHPPQVKNMKIHFIYCELITLQISVRDLVAFCRVQHQVAIFHFIVCEIYVA